MNAGDRAGDSSSPGQGPNPEGLRDSLETMNKVAERLRGRKLDQETLELAREASQGLRGFGRTFNDADRRKLEEAARELGKPDDGNLPKPPAVEQPKKELPEGKVREDFGAQRDLRRVENRQDPMQEDPLRRTIEAGQARVAPEYRKPLEDYYRSVSE
ncbi:MAG: hypothetical protein M5U26_07525 [Planctomycetota bacterium]|nr:hypothetical protein [Planctomycetota bacterium]